MDGDAEGEEFIWVDKTVGAVNLSTERNLEWTGRLTQAQSVLSVDSRTGLYMYSPPPQRVLPGESRTA